MKFTGLKIHKNPTEMTATQLNLIGGNTTGLDHGRKVKVIETAKEYIWRRRLADNWQTLTVIAIIDETIYYTTGKKLLTVKWRELTKDEIKLYAATGKLPTD